jgi:DNA-binding CsgD family transcriptional regulator
MRARRGRGQHVATGSGLASLTPTERSVVALGELKSARERAQQRFGDGNREAVLFRSLARRWRLPKG